jgi:hypothetical protein
MYRGLVARCSPLLETVGAIDWLVHARLKRNAGLPATRGARRDVHLARRSFRRAVSSSAGSAGLSCLATFGASSRLVHESPTRVKFLLSRGKNELISAFTALQCSVLIAHDIPRLISHSRLTPAGLQYSLNIESASSRRGFASRRVGRHDRIPSIEQDWGRVSKHKGASSPGRLATFRSRPDMTSDHPRSCTIDDVVA